MEEKYRKIAIELGLREEDEDSLCCATVKETPLEKAQAKKIEKLEFQVKNLTALLVENKSSLDFYTESHRELQRDYHKAGERAYALVKEIEELKAIIDKLIEKKK